MVKVCIECKQPARYKAQTFDGQTIYLCEEHVKKWRVAKTSELRSFKSKKT